MENNLQSNLTYNINTIVRLIIKNTMRLYNAWQVPVGFGANKFMFVVHFLKVKNNNDTLFVNDGDYFLTHRLIMVVVHVSKQWTF